MRRRLTNGHRRVTAENLLQVRSLHVYYGQSHALQGVDLSLEKGIQAVVGRNGMGKTTLCNTIMGLVRAHSGSVTFQGQEISGLPAYRIASLGIGYVPQGRRLWPSLSVDEHLRLVESGGSWSVQRIYDTFPRLAQRRRSGAGQLSGGEQQMLTISRALLQDPELLVMDEPTEGLAPVIVDQVVQLLTELASDQSVSVLLIEQNISVATAIAQDVAIMVNGRIGRIIPASELAGDRILQERLLGVGRHSHEDIDIPVSTEPLTSQSKPESDSLVTETQPMDTVGKLDDPVPANKPGYIPPTRWSSAVWNEKSNQTSQPDQSANQTPARPFDAKPEPLHRVPMSLSTAGQNPSIYVAGTYDTKGEELNFMRRCIADHGLSVKSVDLSTSGKTSTADIPPHVIAAYHPNGAGAIDRNDRGSSVREMAVAFERFIRQCQDIAGIISAGGSGGTSLVTPAMRSLPVGVPKVMISTVASGDVGNYVGASDIMMMYSVADIQGLNRISKRVLSNGAKAIVGMVKESQSDSQSQATDTNKPGLALTMFGVTTPAVQQIVDLLKDQYDCLVMHATGTGGRSMEKLADSHLIVAAIDLTTTEVCDMMMGGVFPANEDRFGAFIRTEIPWVGSVGALDMVNFGRRDTVPAQYKNRTFVEHNPQVTLMRTTPSENRQMGEWIANRMNLMQGPVRFIIPEGGVSALDAPGQPFHDPEADQALFEAITGRVRETAKRRLIRTPLHINDPAFAELAVRTLAEINPLPTERVVNYGTI